MSFNVIHVIQRPQCCVSSGTPASPRIGGERSRAYTKSVPIHDYQAAAATIVEFLKLLIGTGRMRLRYRVTAGAGAADPDGFEAREIYVELSGIDTPLLLERGGELLRAIEHIAAKLIRLESEEHDKLSFDAENFKALRARELRLRAETAAEQVLRLGQPFAFAPTSSGERRLLHLAFRALPSVETGSVGEGSQRMLVVYPAGFNRASYTPPVQAAPSRSRHTGTLRGRQGPPHDKRNPGRHDPNKTLK